ncbi:WAS/WASL-interacting protein family member 2-like [Ananas comosus]|uniref:WAS/WASL-interacting protein family member 2-like n=1 Tax=Ananas comosus TaxID=4615 RepID=A0A6P5H016_ANACO|nr:WAS/WASL-interacting protein family member 2-like [Ananas comosus]
MASRLRHPPPPPPPPPSSSRSARWRGLILQDLGIHAPTAASSSASAAPLLNLWWRQGPENESTSRPPPQSMVAPPQSMVASGTRKRKYVPYFEKKFKKMCSVPMAAAVAPSVAANSVAPLARSCDRSRRSCCTRRPLCSCGLLRRPLPSRDRWRRSCRTHRPLRRYGFLRRSPFPISRSMAPTLPPPPPPPSLRLPPPPPPSLLPPLPLPRSRDRWRRSCRPFRRLRHLSPIPPTPRSSRCVVDLAAPATLRLSASSAPSPTRDRVGTYLAAPTRKRCHRSRDRKRGAGGAENEGSAGRQDRRHRS